MTEAAAQDADATGASALSPISSAALYRLWFKPREFFADLGALDSPVEKVLVAWTMGIAGSMHQVDKNIVKSELGRASAGWSDSSSIVLNSWSWYWICVLVAGAVGAVFIWYLGGWWYKKRLQWSGANDAASSDACHVYAYQDLVTSGPEVLLTMLQTAIYANYLEFWQSGSMLSRSMAGLVLVFLFWSVWTSYAAVTTAFAVDRRKAKLWFVVLPMAHAFVVFGIFGAHYAGVGGSAG